jgi:CRP/FNR family transcriptional regulator, cyclic AMP receptor protein
MPIAEMAGYVAALLVFLTFYMKTMIPLRVVGICSNCAFIVYGYLDGLYPVLILHLILLPLNTFRLHEMLRLTQRVRQAASADLNMDWLKPFGSARRVRAGEVLLRKGATADAMFYIVSGRYRLTELGFDIRPGQVVGELGLLSPGRLRTQTLECVEAGEVLQTSYEQAKQLYYQNPEFGFYLLQLSAERLFDNMARLESELAAYKKSDRSSAPSALPTPST